MKRTTGITATAICLALSLSGCGGSEMASLLGAAGGMAVAGAYGVTDANSMMQMAAIGAQVAPDSTTARASQATIASSAAVTNPLTGAAVGGGQTGRGAVAPGTYATRPNTLDGHAACSGFSQSNYRSFAVSGGGDAQLKTMCGQAYEYYNMYLNAIRQGYSAADANRTYAAFQGAATNATSFYTNNRSRSGTGF